MELRLLRSGTLRLLVSIAGVVLYGSPVPVNAEIQATGAENPQILKSGQDSTDDESLNQTQNAERLLRLEEALRSDTERLVQLQQELEQRVEMFDDLTSRKQSLEQDLEEKKKEFGRRKAAGESVDESAFAVEVEKLEQRHALIMKQSENTFQGAKTLQVQIKSLEEKIGKDQRAIEQLTGVLPDAPDKQPGAVESVETRGEAAETPPDSPLPGILPGMPGKPATPQEEAVETAPETAQQIEARQDAEKTAIQARQAEQAVVDFLERKAALEEQIELERDMLGKARETRDNLDQGLRKLRDALQQEISTGASQADLQATQNDLQNLEGIMLKTRQEIDERRRHLDTLHTRLEKVQKDQLQLTREAEDKRLEAEAARKRVSWLDSPLHPQNLWNWFTTRGPRILLVIGVAVLLLFLIRLSVRRVARTVVRQSRGTRATRINRADTLALSLRSAISVLIVIAAILLVFQEAGVDIKTVLGGAAILGVAIAFGAQNLMRDYFTGFLILLEDQFELGDLVTIGNITGTVEKVNMRTTMLRDLEGRMHFIPNGEIKSVTNRTYVWGRAVIEVPVSYRENVDRVMDVLLEVADDLRSDPAFQDSITDDPVMLGVDRFTDYGVVIKFMLKTRPEQMFPVRRQMLRRIKNKFDDEGIEISVPHRVIQQQQLPRS